MRAKSKTKTTIPEKKQSGCCCGSAADAQKSTAAETRIPAAAEEQGSSVSENAGIRSKGCYGGH